MGNVHLVTGYAGEAHVAAEDMASLFAAIIGSGQYVLNRGNMFAASVVSNNQIRIMDGDILMQGRHIRLDGGTYLDLAIDNGSQGYKRNDLIVARYTKNSATGVEECSLVVIKGTETTSEASDPEFTSGDILSGDVQNDFPLYRIPLDGLNVLPLVSLFDTLAETISGVVSTLNQKVPITRKIAGLNMNADITVAQLLTQLAAYYVGGKDVAVKDGGTGASDAATARSNLGITPANIGAAASSHNHSASSITSGTLSSDRLPTVPIAKGGTGSTSGATGLKNLFAAGYTVLSSYQYGTSLPSAGTKGRIFFKKVSG